MRVLNQKLMAYFESGGRVGAMCGVEVGADGLAHHLSLAPW